MLNNFHGKAVLITGGTKGIGLATGLAFGRQGATCTLTHKWGTADEDAIRRAFAAVGAPEPDIVCADAREDEDTVMVLERIRARFDRIEVFVSGAAFAHVVDSVDAYSRRSLLQSIEYTAWPIAGYLQAAHKVFGRYPRYVMGMSSGGPDDFHAHYDIVAACKSTLETICRYLAYRLRDDDVRVNVLRARFVKTDSLAATVGEGFADYVDQVDPTLFITADEVADAALALCSGLMDAVTGQVLMIDRGTSFRDNLNSLFHHRFETQRSQEKDPHA